MENQDNEKRVAKMIYIDVAVESVDCSQSSQGMEDLQDREADRK